MRTPSFRLMTPVVLTFAALSVAACSKKESATGDSTGTSTAVTATSSGSLAPSSDSAAAAAATPLAPSQFSDANILEKELAGDSSEVAIAGLAKQMATDPSVKAYAAQLVTDHSRGMKAVAALVTKLAITPVTPPGDTTAQATEHMVTRLQALAKGPAFDTVFVNHEIEDHTADISDAKAMSGAAKDPQVKSLVEKSLPELQKHLDHAQRIAKSKK
jgi:putative membrane protein